MAFAPCDSFAGIPGQVLLSVGWLNIYQGGTVVCAEAGTAYKTILAHIDIHIASRPFNLFDINL